MEKGQLGILRVFLLLPIFFKGCCFREGLTAPGIVAIPQTVLLAD